MIRPRIIPCLLIKDKGLVKSEKFSNFKYVGDPLNAVRIFNEKRSDELIVLDINCSKENREPNYQLIEKIASECRMPLCYGGGIKNAEQAIKILSLGVEKISLSSSAILTPNLITEISNQAGAQSVVVTIDYKKSLFGSEQVYIYNGTKKTSLKALDFAIEAQDKGAGEIVFNSIDNDGTLNGYDLKFLKQAKEKLHVPITALGGAASLENISSTARELGGVIGLGVGRLFVLKGKHKAVLINYSNNI